MQLIRGERVLQAIEQDEALNEDSTYSDLFQNIKRGFPHTKKRQHAVGEVTISKITFTAFVPNRAFQVNSSTRSNNNDYNQTIQFQDVNYKQHEDESTVTFIGKDGKDYHMEPVGLRRKTLRVSCDCLDFHWRFKLWNFNDDSLVGRAPPSYVPSGKRPPVNPLKVPGFCKHLIKVFRHLKQGRVIK